jgi:hypothetical protein
VLWNHADETYGVADLLVRADVLERVVPGTLDTELAHASSPALGTSWHYRAIDIKFHALDLLADRAASPTQAISSAAVGRTAATAATAASTVSRASSRCASTATAGPLPT